MHLSLPYFTLRQRARLSAPLRLALACAACLAAFVALPASAATAVGVSKLASSPSTVVNGTTATGTIVLSAPAPSGADPSGNPINGVTVAVTGLQSNLFTYQNSQNADGSYTTTDQNGDTAYVFIPSGDITGTFTYMANVVSSTIPADMQATLGASSATTSVKIVPTLPAAITITPGAVYNGNTVSVTVTLQTPAYEYVYASNGTNTVSPGDSVNITFSSLSAQPTSPYSQYNADGSILYSYPGSQTATLVIPQGQSTGTFTLATGPVTANQTFTVTGTDNGKTVAGSFTITPSSITSVTVAPSPVAVGGAAEGTVLLSAPAAASSNPNGGSQTTPGVTVSLTTSDPTLSFAGPGQEHVNADGSSYYVDYTGRYAYLFIPQGSTIGTFALAAANTFANLNVTITGALYGSVQSTVVTVLANTILSNRGNSSKIYNGNSAFGTITLNGPAGPSMNDNKYVSGVDVQLDSSDPSVSFGAPFSSTQNPDGSVLYVDYDGTATLYIPTGHSSGTYPLNTFAVSQPTTSTVTATLGGVTRARLVTVTPTSLSGMVSSLHTVHSNQQAILTVILSGPAVSYQQSNGNGGTTNQPGVLINLTSSNPNVLFSSVNGSAVYNSGFGTATLYLPAGATSASYAVSSGYSQLPSTATVTASLYASQRVINLILKQ